MNEVHLTRFHLPKLPSRLKETDLVEHMLAYTYLPSILTQYTYPVYLLYVYYMYTISSIPDTGTNTDTDTAIDRQQSVPAAPPPHSECDHMFSSASPETAISPSPSPSPSPSRGFMDREWTRRRAAGVVDWTMPSQTARQCGTYQSDSSHKDTLCLFPSPPCLPPSHPIPSHPIHLSLYPSIQPSAPPPIHLFHLSTLSTPSMAPISSAVCVDRLLDWGTWCVTLDR
ncbi:hypothetical protein F4859DRAFT_154283 [Xylaria cf. heliscus]|nr:hypothetical protein F4859DRAFT_154283 [Xylaria cf. heliscus]